MLCNVLYVWYFYVVIINIIIFIRFLNVQLSESFGERINIRWFNKITVWTGCLNALYSVHLELTWYRLILVWQRSHCSYQPIKTTWYGTYNCYETGNCSLVLNTPSDHHRDGRVVRWRLEQYAQPFIHTHQPFSNFSTYAPPTIVKHNRLATQIVAVRTSHTT
jgi:hypothetical protein